jgi:hypothetical protein
MSLQEIYAHVSEELVLDADDRKPEAHGSSQEAWQRNVRNVLVGLVNQRSVVRESKGVYRAAGAGDDWSDPELNLIVSDYFDMFRKELGGSTYVKSDHNRAIRENLNGRSKSSVEFKHQNISAVLQEMDLPFISGYKPRGNAQDALRAKVIDQLNDDAELLELLSTTADSGPANLQQKTASLDWNDVERDPPDLSDAPPQPCSDARTPVKINYGEREARNRKLGREGELFILEYEKQRLKQGGRGDLAQEIEWTSDVKGDGLGYDIKSFEADGSERYIEVKTTKNGIHQAFYVSANEVRASQELGQSYVLARVYALSSEPKLYFLRGPIDKHAFLYPTEYRIQISSST